jgi:hypothetical protein
MSFRFPPVRETASGMPCASVIRWCFEPGLARSTGLGPVWAALHRAHVRAVNHRPGPVQRPGGVQLGQQRLVQLLPDPGFVPVPQPPPARHPGPEAKLLRQELPRDAGVEHEQDAAQDLAVIQPPAAGMIGPPRDDRQQRLDPGPQVVRDDPRWLLSLPHSQAQLSHEHRYSPHVILLGVLSGRSVPSAQPDVRRVAADSAAGAGRMPFNGLRRSVAPAG